VEYVKGWNPNLIVVAAFGQILPPEILDIPALGCINVHASILPRWRGAAPIRAAILHGDPKTGVTIMEMDPGLDTGPILHTCEIAINPGETYEELNKKLAELGAEALLEILPKYLSGEVTPLPQDDKLATYASMVKKSDAELDFSLPAEKLEKAVRAYNPWPGAYTIIESQRFKILKAHVSDEPSPGIGVLTQIGDYPAIGTGNSILVLEEIQPAGKKVMKGDVFLRGARSWGK
jgi:methionyl-tRNA formyltransferase